MVNKSAKYKYVNLPSFTVRGVIFPTSGVTKLIEFTMGVSGQINSIFGWVFSLF